MISSCSASAQGDRTLVGDKGYRRFLKNRSAHSTIDDPKVEADFRAFLTLLLQQELQRRRRDEGPESLVLQSATQPFFSFRPGRRR